MEDASDVAASFLGWKCSGLVLDGSDSQKWDICSATVILMVGWCRMCIRVWCGEWKRTGVVGGGERRKKGFGNKSFLPRRRLPTFAALHVQPGPDVGRCFTFHPMNEHVFTSWANM